MININYDHWNAHRKLHIHTGEDSGSDWSDCGGEQSVRSMRFKHSNLTKFRVQAQLKVSAQLLVRSSAGATFKFEVVSGSEATDACVAFCHNSISTFIQVVSRRCAAVMCGPGRLLKSRGDRQTGQTGQTGPQGREDRQD